MNTRWKESTTVRSASIRSVFVALMSLVKNRHVRSALRVALDEHQQFAL